MYMLRYKFREAADLQGGATDLQGGANAPPPPPPPLNAALHMQHTHTHYKMLHLWNLLAPSPTLLATPKYYFNMADSFHWWPSLLLFSGDKSSAIQPTTLINYWCTHTHVYTDVHTHTQIHTHTPNPPTHPLTHKHTHTHTHTTKCFIYGTYWLPHLYV